jgi:hypothetical protein
MRATEMSAYSLGRRCTAKPSLVDDEAAAPITDPHPASIAEPQSREEDV